MIADHKLFAPNLTSAIQVAVSRHLRRHWVVSGFTDLNDRASHPSGILHGADLSVFAKLDPAAEPGAAAAAFAVELDGLRLLHDRSGVAVPTPIGSGTLVVDGGALLLTEAVSERAPRSRTTADWRAVGRALATLHQCHAERFGLELFNGRFGAVQLDNAPVASNRCADFYAERRVLPLLRSVVDQRKLPVETAHDLERLMDRLESLCGPEPLPTLLHGDAQQHNFISTDAGAVVVDAAPYYGHPEIDLTLLDYFQPVPDVVFDGYREVLPIDAGFAQRRNLWRIFVDLACIAVGSEEFGRAALDRLNDSVRHYR